MSEFLVVDLGGRQRLNRDRLRRMHERRLKERAAVEQETKARAAELEALRKEQAEREEALKGLRKEHAEAEIDPCPFIPLQNDLLVRMDSPSRCRVFAATAPLLHMSAEQLASAMNSTTTMVESWLGKRRSRELRRAPSPGQMAVIRRMLTKRREAIDGALRKLGAELLS